MKIIIEYEDLNINPELLCEPLSCQQSGFKAKNQIFVW